MYSCTDVNHNCSLYMKFGRSMNTVILDDQIREKGVKLNEARVYLSQKGNMYFSLDNVVVGGACIYNEQCKGTEHSGVCSHGTCACERGYIFIDQHCHEGRNTFRFLLNLFFEEVSYSVQRVNVYAGIFSLTKGTPDKLSVLLNVCVIF